MVDKNKVTLMEAAGFDEETAIVLAEANISAEAALAVQADAKTIEAIIAEFEIDEDFAYMQNAIAEKDKQVAHEAHLKKSWERFEKLYFQLIEYDKALKETPGKYKDKWDDLDATNAELNAKGYNDPALRDRAAGLHTTIQAIRSKVVQEREELLALDLAEQVEIGALDFMRRRHPHKVSKLNIKRVMSYMPNLFENKESDNNE